jgi:hypothetical protein
MVTALGQPATRVDTGADLADLVAGIRPFAGLWRPATSGPELQRPRNDDRTSPSPARR